MKQFDMTGRTTVITGSSRGIGRAIAKEIAAAGGNVVISSRKAEACDAVAAAINEKGGGRAIAVPANISSKDDLQRLVDETHRQLGDIHALVCNAASNPYYGPMGGMADEQFRKILDNNIVAQHWLIAMVAPELRARKQGAILIISSIGGLRGTPVIGAYAISKAADMQMARNLAIEFGGDNVRVNTIAPGLIKTDFAKALWEDPEMLRRSEERSPLGRIGEPHEIAGAALWLVSDASSFVTGQTIVIDGGQTI